MKSIDLFCASPASTAICSSMDQRSMVRNGTRPLDHRRNHQISDHRRKPKNNIPLLPNCSSQIPINPTPYYQKSRKSTTSAYASTSAKQSEQVLRRKSSADIKDQITTPYGSTRYLLSDTPFSDFVSESDDLSALVVSQPVNMPRSLSSNDSHISKPTLVSSQPLTEPRRQLSSNDSRVLKSMDTRLVASQPVKSSRQSANDYPVLKSSSARSRSRSQVVELLVSIHCKGCEGKVRKHISRMEGVTSFSIDRATKKVIVIGEVTPLGVLSSISRVKKAQFWPSPSSSSSSSPSTVALV